MPDQHGSNSPIWWPTGVTCSNLHNNIHNPRPTGMGVNFNLCDNRHVRPGSRPKPPLLRLDSTGQISSDEDSVSASASNFQPSGSENPASSSMDRLGLGCKSGLIQPSQGSGILNFSTLTRNYSSPCHTKGDKSMDMMNGLGTSNMYYGAPLLQQSTASSKRPQKSDGICGSFPWVGPFGQVWPNSGAAAFPRFAGAMPYWPNGHATPPSFGVDAANARFLLPHSAQWTQFAGQQWVPCGGYPRKPPASQQRQYATAKRHRACRPTKETTSTTVNVCSPKPTTETETQKTLCGLLEGVKDLSITADSSQDSGEADCEQEVDSKQNHIQERPEPQRKCATVTADSLKSTADIMELEMAETQVSDSSSETGELPNHDRVIASDATSSIPIAVSDGDDCDLKTGTSLRFQIQVFGAENEKPLHVNAHIQPCAASTPEHGKSAEKTPPKTDPQDSRKKKKSRPSSKKRRRQKLKRSDGQCSIHFVARDDQNLATKRLRTSPQGQNEQASQDSGNSAEGGTDSCLRFVVAPSTKSDSDCSDVGAKFSFVVHASELDDSSSSDSDSWEDQGFDEVEDQGFDDVDSALCDFLDSDILPSPLRFHFTVRTLDSCDIDQDSSVDEAVQEANSKWNVSYPEPCEPLDECPSEKVHFAPETSLLTIHRETSWPLDVYMEARRGPWEEYARDRQRFRNRIQEVERAVGHCVTPTHRNHMYKVLYGKEEGS